MPAKDTFRKARTRTGADRADDVFEEPRVVARSCAASVDERRASAASETERIDPKRSAAPIDMSMQVDEARRNDEAADVLDLRAGKS